MLGTEELADYAKKRALNVQRQELSNLRREWKFTAMFKPGKRPPSYMSSTFFRYGVCMIDMAFFPRKLAKRNGGYTGFLVCVEMTTLQLATVPLKNKSAAEWTRGIKEIAETSTINGITKLISDKEAALTSKTFQEKLKRERGISMAFITRRHKAYYAERFIGIVKSQLSQKMEHSRLAGDKDWDNWVKIMPTIVRQQNQKQIPGTSIRRNSVDSSNFIKMLDIKKGGDSQAMMNTMNFSDTAIKSDRWRSRLFRYRRGQSVLVDKRALAGKDRRQTFEKPSTAGSYSKKTYVVASASLKKGGKFTLAVVYKIRPLAGGRPLDGSFYESDLQAYTGKEEEEEQ